MSAQHFFCKTPEGESVMFRLHPLSEYQEYGGCFDDSGNGGEDFSQESDQFLAAISVEAGNTGSEERDLLTDVAEVKPEDLWRDTVTGWWLLRDWPANAPLEARMVGD